MNELNIPEPEGQLTDEAVGALMDSFAEHYGRGERHRITEYVHRHPELAGKIRDLFPALELLLAEVEEAHAASEESGTAPSEELQVSRRPHTMKGLRLGGYLIVREVGRGGMGVVYEAREEALGRRVALKVLPFHALLDPKKLERFQREAKAAAMLQHPNIVSIYGVGEDRGIHFYAMQFIDGLGLDEVLEELKDLAPARSARKRGGVRSGKNPSTSSTSLRLLTGKETVAAAIDPEYFDAVARLGASVADALASAHAQGILHRDIKPSNLLLDLNGRVWVTDFGLAKAAGSDDVTQSGDIVGTLRYLPPERLQGWSDPRSDVYSLGLTLYELATFQPAFEAADRSVLLKKLIDTDSSPPLPSKLNRFVPRDLETVLLKAIAREPGLRYQTARELAEDLRCFLARQPIRARTVAPWERTLKWARRRPALASLFLVTSLSLFAILTGALWFNARLRRENARAEASFQRAREPVEKLLAAMAKKVERNRDEIRPSEGDLINAVLSFYEGFMKDRAVDAEVLRGASLAYEQRGDYQRRSRDHAAAIMSYERALDVMKAWTVGGHDPLLPRSDTAALHNKLSVALAGAGRDGEVLQTLRDAWSYLERPPSFYLSVAAKVATGRGAEARGPASLAAGDFDGDGNTDFAAANFGSDDVAVLARNRDGSYGAPVSVTVGTRPRTLAAADLDGDQDLDLAVANQIANGVSILANEKGAFTVDVACPVGDMPWFLQAGDLDGDGDVDLAATVGRQTVKVLWNEPRAVFTKVDSHTVAPSSNELAITDLDRDGDLDLAIACVGSGAQDDPGCVFLLLNDGKRGFLPGGKVTAGTGPKHLLAADLDRDGATDLVAANPTHNTVPVLLNKGFGSFAAPSVLDVEENPSSLAAADFDGDGDLDLAVGHSHSHDLYVFQNDGKGRLHSPVLYGTGRGPNGFATGDWNWDGRVDLAVLSYASSDVWVYLNLPAEGGRADTTGQGK